MLGAIFVYIEPISVSSVFAAVFLHMPTIPTGNDILNEERKEDAILDIYGIKIQTYISKRK